MEMRPRGTDFANARYTILRHSVSEVRYHIILNTKYRRKVFCGEMEAFFLECLHFIQSVSHFYVERAAGDESHAHLLVRAAPDISLTAIVRRIKQMLTHRFWKDKAKEMRRFYAEKNTLFTQSYYAATTGAVNTEQLHEYLSHHAEDKEHKALGFEGK